MKSSTQGNCQLCGFFGERFPIKLKNENENSTRFVCQNCKEHCERTNAIRIMKSSNQVQKVYVYRDRVTNDILFKVHARDIEHAFEKMKVLYSANVLLMNILTYQEYWDENKAFNERIWGH